MNDVDLQISFWKTSLQFLFGSSNTIIVVFKNLFSALGVVQRCPSIEDQMSPLLRAGEPSTTVRMSPAPPAG